MKVACAAIICPPSAFALLYSHHIPACLEFKILFCSHDNAVSSRALASMVVTMETSRSQNNLHEDTILFNSVFLQYNYLRIFWALWSPDLTWWWVQVEVIEGISEVYTIESCGWGRDVGVDLRWVACCYLIHKNEMTSLLLHTVGRLSLWAKFCPLFSVELFGISRFV